MTLFDDEFGRIHPIEPDRTHEPAHEQRHAQVVRVVPDVPAMDRALDYALPAALEGRVGVGCVVRVPLHGRRVRGWVVELDVEASSGRDLVEVTKLTGLALDAETVDLARWIAWRWVGRLPSVLRLGTTDRVVTAPSRRPASAAQPSRVPQGSDPVFSEAALLLDQGPGTRIYQVSPCSDHGAIALAAAARGQALVITPSVEESSRITSLLRRSGAAVAGWPGGTAGALAGHAVVGGHTAVLAPMPQLRAVVVLDEHDQRHQNESSPTWHAREVAIERARRAGVPCLLVSPMPSVEARLSVASGPPRPPSGEPGAAPGDPGTLYPVDTARRRSGWARTIVVDRRGDDPRTGLFSPRFVDAARRELDEGHTVVCVLNRTGRSRLLACRSCDTIARCEACGAAVRSLDDEVLQCIRCGVTRPRICLQCGSHAMKVLRMGVARVREDLGALFGVGVGLVTASESDSERTRLIVGTEAVLHARQRARSARVAMVAFLDFDQELLAARYRAAEQALGLVVMASRLVGGRSGSVLLQTRNPAHEVIRAAVGAEPSVLSDAELERREMLGLPPVSSIAAVGGEAAPEWIRRLGNPPGVDVQGPRDGWWLLRADDPATLADAAGAVKRPAGRLRLRVDPMQLPL